MFVCKYKESDKYSPSDLFLINEREFTDLLKNVNSVTYYLNVGRGWDEDDEFDMEEHCTVAYPVEYVT